MNHRFSQYVIPVATFLLGVILSIIIEKGLSSPLPPEWANIFFISLLISILILVILSAGMRLGVDKTRDEIKDLMKTQMDSMGIVVVPNIEIWREGVEREGKLFDLRQTHTDKAERSIRIVANLSVELTPSNKDKKKRERFLRAIENNIRKRLQSGGEFTYARVSQALDNPQLGYPQLTKTHFQRLDEMKRDYPVTFKLKHTKIRSNIDFSFILVDEDKVTIEIAGIKTFPNKGKESVKYTLGFISFTDRTKKLYTKFSDYFETLLFDEIPDDDSE